MELPDKVGFEIEFECEEVAGCVYAQGTGGVGEQVGERNIMNEE